MADFNKLQFFDNTQKKVFDIQFTLANKPRTYSYNNPTTPRLYFDLSFLDMLVDKVEVLPKNKNLIKAIKHLKNFMLTKCTGIETLHYDYMNFPEPLPYPRNNQIHTKNLTPQEWQEIIKNLKNKFFMSPSVHKTAFKNNLKGLEAIASVNYNKMLYDYSPKDIKFSFNDSFEKEEQCPLYSQSHTDKTIAIVNKTEKLFSKIDAYLEEIDKFQKLYANRPLEIDFFNIIKSASLTQSAKEKLYLL